MFMRHGEERARWRASPARSRPPGCCRSSRRDWPQAGLLHGQRRRGRPPRGRPARHSVLRPRLSGRVRPDHRLLRRRIHARPHAQPLRDVQQLAQVRQAVRLCRQRRRRVRRHRAITRGCSTAAGGTAAALLPRASTTARISRTCCSASSGELLPRMLLPVGRVSASRRFASIAASWACAWPTRRTARKSASCTSGEHDEFVRRRQRRAIDTAGEIVTTDGTRRRRSIDGHRAVHDRPAQGAGRGAGRAALRRAHRADTHRVVIGEQEELARTRTDGQPTQLARRSAGRRASLPGQDPLQQPSRVRRRSTCSPASGFARAVRRAAASASRRARRWSATTATACSAAAGFE